jgi:nucleotide-binding universal stress UspA family protein
MFNHILVPLDGSLLADCVLPHVAAMASANNAKVTLLRVLEEQIKKDAGQSIDALTWHMEEAQAKNELRATANDLLQVLKDVDFEVIYGQPANAIISFAKNNNVEMIILSSHGKSGLSEWNVSSVVLKVIQRAMLPITVIRAYNPIDTETKSLKYQKIMIPLDGSQRAECALPAALRLARYFNATVYPVHIVMKPEMSIREPFTREIHSLIEQLIEINTSEASKYLNEITSRLDCKGVTLESRLMVDENPSGPLHHIIETEDIDLVVISAHGNTGSRRWPYGSVAANLVSYGTTPLMIINDMPSSEIEHTKAELVMLQKKGH